MDFNMYVKIHIQYPEIMEFKLYYCENNIIYIAVYSFKIKGVLWQ